MAAGTTVNLKLRLLTLNSGTISPSVHFEIFYLNTFLYLVEDVSVSCSTNPLTLNNKM